MKIIIAVLFITVLGVTGVLGGRHLEEQGRVAGFVQGCSVATNDIFTAVLGIRVPPEQITKACQDLSKEVKK